MVTQDYLADILDLDFEFIYAFIQVMNEDDEREVLRLECDEDISQILSNDQIRFEFMHVLNCDNGEYVWVWFGSDKYKSIDEYWSVCAHDKIRISLGQIMSNILKVFIGERGDEFKYNSKDLDIEFIRKELDLSFDRYNKFIKELATNMTLDITYDKDVFPLIHIIEQERDELLNLFPILKIVRDSYQYHIDEFSEDYDAQAFENDVINYIRAQLNINYEQHNVDSILRVWTIIDE